LLSLSGQWLEELSDEEKDDVLSMVGDVHEVYEIDEYGLAWVSKFWPDDEESRYRAHSIGLSSQDMEIARPKPDE
jgi:hypothetical protein